MSLFDNLQMGIAPMSHPNLDAGLESAAGHLADVLVAGAEASAAIAQLETENASEVSGLLAAIDRLNVAFDGLSNLEEQARDAQKDGGLTRREAAIWNNGLNIIGQVIGVDDFGTPGLESFGGANTRAASTIAACENAKAWFQKVWAQVTAYLEKLKTAGQNFWRQLFDSGVKLAAYGAKVSAKADKMGSTIDKDKELTFKGADVLCDANGAFNPKTLAATAKELLAFISDDLKVELDNSTGLVEGIAAYLDADLEETKLAAAKVAFNAVLTKTLYNRTGMTKGTGADGKPNYAGTVLPGNKAIQIINIGKDTGDLGLEAAKKGAADDKGGKDKGGEGKSGSSQRAKDLAAGPKVIKRVFATAKKLSTAPKAEVEKQEPLAKSDIQTIAGFAEQASAAYQSRQGENDKLGKAISDLIAKGKGKVGELEGKDQFAGEVKALVSLATSLSGSSAAVPMMAAAHVIKCFRAMLAICEVSIGGYTNEA